MHQPTQNRDNLTAWMEGLPLITLKECYQWYDPADEGVGPEQCYFMTSARDMSVTVADLAIRRMINVPAN